MSTRDVHVYPLGEQCEHFTEGRMCLCNPRFAVPCDECDGSDSGCWRCIEGLKDTTPDEADPCVIIHNALHP